MRGDTPQSCAILADISRCTLIIFYPSQRWPGFFCLAAASEVGALTAIVYTADSTFMKYTPDPVGTGLCLLVST